MATWALDRTAAPGRLPGVLAAAATLLAAGICGSALPACCSRTQALPRGERIATVSSPNGKDTAYLYRLPNCGYELWLGGQDIHEPVLFRTYDLPCDAATPRVN